MGFVSEGMAPDVLSPHSPCPRPHSSALRTVVGTLCWILILGSHRPAELRSQEQELRFQKITMEDGLPESRVLQILQDRLGFLWFGTTNGLVRYDGYGFTTYKPDPEDPYSLSGRLIRSLVEDRAGRLWIGTMSGGLNRFDRERERFIHYRHDRGNPESLSSDSVNAIREDGEGVLWIGTGNMEIPDPGGGLDRFDPQSGTFQRYQHDPEDPASLSRGPVTSIREDRDGGLWVATAGGGLDRFDRNTPTFIHYRDVPAGPNSWHDDGISLLHADRAGRLWVGTWGSGLECFDPRTETFKHYRHDPEDPASLSHDSILSLLEDQEGTLWVGTWDGVLHRYEPESDSFTRHRHDPRNPNSLSNNSGIRAIFEDRTGTLWFATAGVGLDKLDRFGSKFFHCAHDPDNARSLSDNRVAALYEDHAGNLWVGTKGGGLNRVDLKNGTATHFRHQPGRPDSLGNDHVRAVHEGPDGVLWVGTTHGLDRFDAATESFTHFVHDPDDPTSLSGSTVSVLHVDPAGALWVGTWDGGLSRLDPGTGKFTRYRHRSDDARSLPNNMVSAIYQDTRGTLWIGTEGSGLCRFHPETETFTTYYSPETGLDIIVSLHEDRDGRLWVGTYNGGLHLFDRETGTSRYFNDRNGLPHDTVYSIVGDDDGRLWISTGRGLTVLDPRSETFRSYDHTDGLRSDWFFGGAVKTSGGKLFFGGNNGMYAFSPRNLEDNPHPPQVVFTGFWIANQRVEIGEDAPLDKHISVADEIRLRHDENLLMFKFAAMHYSYPEGNQYAYRMDPFDTGWNEVGSKNWATYTNLPPGEYTFRVKAANSDAVWNEEGSSIRLHISPPWWQTWWAWSSYAVVLLVGLVSADRLQRARVVRREQEKAKQIETRLRAEAAELQARAAEAQARALQVENERQTQELEGARQLQLSMLPEQVPQHPQLEIAATMKTATEVGGDYYDFDLADDGTLTIAIGDATGHGSKAGTMVTAAKSLFNFLAGEPDMVQVLRRSTGAIKRMKMRNLYMAMMLARVSDSKLEVANAGMPPVLIHRAASGRVEEIHLEGVPLGSFSGFPYQKKTVDLEPGDTVVLMSDGFPEILSPAGDVFGYERLEDVLREAAERPPREVIRHFTQTAAEWAEGRPQDDDMTFVVMKVKA
ncbi:MAG: SpoIIE family protein phosphatase [bacterium]|nr:SpoIIE family protein phosphatase [bacterium]